MSWVWSTPETICSPMGAGDWRDGGKGDDPLSAGAPVLPVGSPRCRPAAGTERAGPLARRKKSLAAGQSAHVQARPMKSKSRPLSAACPGFSPGA